MAKYSFDFPNTSLLFCYAIDLNNKDNLLFIIATSIMRKTGLLVLLKWNFLIDVKYLVLSSLKYDCYSPRFFHPVSMIKWLLYNDIFDMHCYNLFAIFSMLFSNLNRALLSVFIVLHRCVLFRISCFESVVAMITSQLN